MVYNCRIQNLTFPCVDESHTRVLAKIKSRWKRTHLLLIWRRRWDSNPRAPKGKRISSAPRYDHFDTSPYFHAHLLYHNDGFYSSFKLFFVMFFGCEEFTAELLVRHKLIQMRKVDPVIPKHVEKWHVRVDTLKDD